MIPESQNLKSLLFEPVSSSGVIFLLLDVLSSLALVVMPAMALGRIQIGQNDKIRSLVAPVEKAA
jgi:hypothetical protein